MVEDTSLFIGLTSVPYGKVLDFYDKEIIQLFNNYKKRVADNFNGSHSKYVEEFAKYFYVPKGYYIFGNFDLALLALIDDYEFGSRTFSSFHPSFYNPEISKENEYEYSSFKHQVILGPATSLPKNENLLQASAKTFLNENSNLPLLSISQLKLSNHFLITYGESFIRSVIKTIAYKLTQKQIELRESLNTPNTNFEFIITESFSWNEITLVIFSNAFSCVFEIIPSIRELFLGEMLDILKQNNDQDIEIFDRPSLFTKIVKESPSDFIENEKFLPLINNSTTITGFDFNIIKELFDKKNNNTTITPLYDSICADDEINPICRLATKGGYLANAIDDLLILDRKLDLCLGRADILYKLHNDIVKTKVYIDLIADVIFKEKSNSYLNSIYTIPSRNVNFETELYKKTNDEIGRVNKYRNEVKKLEIKLIDIRTVRENLKKLGIHKVLVSDVLNMIGNYNNAINDPILFANFVEIRPFIDFIIDYINHKAFQNSLQRVNKILYNAIHSFAYAYDNRFHISFHTNEVTDDNMFYKGGIQRLVTAYSGYYRLVCTALGNPSNIVFIEGSPNVEATELGLKLNYYHIFLPALLMNSAINEASIINIVIYNEDYSNGFNNLLWFTSSHANAFELIHNVIRRSPHFTKKRYKTDKEILEIISPIFFDHVFSDITTFYLTYQGDPELFVYWFLGFYTVASTSYEKQGEFSESSLVFILLRILSVLKFCSTEEAFSKFSLDFGKNLKGHNVEIIEKVKNVISNYFCSTPIAAWFANAKAHVGKIITKISYENNIEFYRSHILSLAKETMNQIESGTIPIFKMDDQTEYSSFVNSQLLLYSYLSLLKNKFFNPTLNNILNRNSADGSIMIDHEVDAKFMFDPLGGNFVVDPESRRELLKYNGVLMTALWDISMKNKESFILSKLNS